MKTLSLLLVLISTCALAQEHQYRFGAGATLSTIKNVDADSKWKPLGYFIYGSMSGKLTERTKFTGAITYINQTTKIAGMDIDVNSVIGSFNYDFYPIKNHLKVIAGFQLGMVIGSEFENESMKQQMDGQMGFLGGIGYEFLKKFEVKAIYNHLVTDHVFDNVIQVGVGYQL